ncbi:hypothetical protein [Helicobacter sp. 23-1045]
MRESYVWILDSRLLDSRGLDSSLTLFAQNDEVGANLKIFCKNLRFALQW